MKRAMLAAGLRTVLLGWFRFHLMGDIAQRNYFYGPSRTFCADSRVQVARNMFLTQ